MAFAAQSRRIGIRLQYNTASAWHEAIQDQHPPKPSRHPLGKGTAKFMNSQTKIRNSGSFVNNMSLPVHRWFRYSAGFSAKWAEELISQKARSTLTPISVLDPFVGSGTTLVAAEHCGIESWGIDSHPFIARVAEAKLAYRSSPENYLHKATAVLDLAMRQIPSLESYADLVRKCYSDDSLRQLDCLRQAVVSNRDDTDSYRLIWLTLVSILRSTSHRRF